MSCLDCSLEISEPTVVIAQTSFASCVARDYTVLSGYVLLKPKNVETILERVCIQNSVDHCHMTSQWTYWWTTKLECQPR